MRNTKTSTYNFLKIALEKGDKLINNAINHELSSKDKTSEASVQSQVVAYLELERALGRCFYQRTNTMAVKDGERYRALPQGVHKGFMDVIFVKGGKIIGVEFKSNSGKQSDDQIAIEQEFLKQGGQYWLVRSREYFIERYKGL